jgi:hypothetical protein
LSQELLGSEVAESLVGADGVVSSLPVEQFLVELGDRERAGGDLIELLGRSAVGALDAAVQFGGARGQDEEADAALLASLFEDGGESASWRIAASPETKPPPWKWRGDGLRSRPSARPRRAP